MSPDRNIKVFIASPGDLAVERRAFKEVIDELNKGFGRGAHVKFEPLGWEDALSTVGRRSQSVINQDIDACDVFVLVMWRRWGQEALDAAPFDSYTEEEFHRALARYEVKKSPTLFVFFKHIDPAQMANPDPQLAKVLAFRKKLEQTHKVLYRSFDDEKSFRNEIDLHLVAFAEGKCKSLDPALGLPIIPDSIQAELNRHRADAERAVEELKVLRTNAKLAQDDAERAHAQAKDANARAEAAERVTETRAAARLLALAEDAAKAALNGKIEEARQGFAKALDGSTNPQVLYLGVQFFTRIGELDEAERLVRRWLAICGGDSVTAETASAYVNLGAILLTRHKFDEAETVYRKALSIEHKLGRLGGVASNYGNLGIVFRNRGDLDNAEVMFRKALEIEEDLGLKKDMAIDYCNLGAVLKDRGNLSEAEAMFQRSLQIEEELGRVANIANNYNNLGAILSARGELDRAEELYRRSLEINEKLERTEGISIACSNIGNILKTRRDLAGAVAMYRRSLAMETKLCRPEGMSPICSALGEILSNLGNLDEADTMFRNALELEKKLDRPAGVARAFGDIGMVANLRGDCKTARELWIKSRDQFAELGMENLVKRIQGWLDKLTD